jgi:hypothetical protein
MSAAVHRYARAPHMAALSNALDLALASLKCQAWSQVCMGFIDGELCVPSRPQGEAHVDSLVPTTPAAPFTTGLKFPSLETTETFRAATAARLPR